MKFLGIQIGGSSNENEVVGYEIDLFEIGPDDHPFEGVPTGTEVKEQGAPSLFGDYSNYPGGYPQAVRDWRNGEYEAPTQEDEVEDDIGEEEEESEPRRKFLGLF